MMMMNKKNNPGIPGLLMTSFGLNRFKKLASEVFGFSLDSIGLDWIFS